MTEWIKYAKVGDKVVCVDASSRFGRAWMHLDGPVEGSVYTILDIWIDGIGDTVFEFNELRRHWRASAILGYRAGYNAIRFRPVQPRKTDISALTKLLNNVPAKQLESEDA